MNVDGEPPGQGEPAKAPRSEWLSRDVSEFLLNRARETADLINDRVRRAVVHGPPPARSLRVLVIEDERDTLLTFTHLFTLFGHDVSFALTPATAIAEVLVRPPDVVISDIRLPGWDGCDLAPELLATIASVHGTRPLLVALTGLGDEARERCLAAGFDHFFAKPAAPEVLERLLNDFAGRPFDRPHDAAH